MSGYVGQSTVVGGTSSIAPSYTPTTGNLLVLSVAWDGTTNTPATPTGWSLGNVTAAANGSSVGVAIFYILSASGAVNPTVSVTSATDMYGQIAEYNSGAAWTFGAGNGTSALSNATSITTPTVTPPQTNSLIVTVWGGSGNSNGDTITPSTTGGPAFGSPNPIGSNLTGLSTMDFADFYQIDTTTSTFTDTFTSQTQFMGCAFATFKYTPAGAGVSIAWIRS
jgi:hypothetical protein